MDHDDLAVARLVDVQLDEVDPEPERPAERREAVLRPEARPAPVGGDGGPAGARPPPAAATAISRSAGQERAGPDPPPAVAPAAHDPDHDRYSTSSSTYPRR